MNNNLINPFQLLVEKSQQAWSGCMTIAEPKDDSVGWLIYWAVGKIQYATSTTGKQDRLLYLWQQFNPPTNCPTLKPEYCEYSQLSEWLNAKKISDLDISQLLFKFTQEALIQVASINQTTVQLEENFTLDKSITEFAWEQFNLKSEVNKWIPVRSYLGSPFSRLILEQSNSLRFFKIWKKLYDNPELADLANAKKLSSLVAIFAQKKSFYYLASQVKINPLKFAYYLKPSIEQNIVSLLPYQQNITTPQTKTNSELTKVTNSNRQQPSPNQPANSINKKLDEQPLIACIDDSKTVQKQVKMILEAIGYQVIAITDPTAALRGLSHQQPVLILMDINMPNINGYDLCSMLRKSYKFQAIPIVMLTGRDGVIDRMRAKFVGSSDYLTKPFEPSQLVKMVNKYHQITASV